MKKNDTNLKPCPLCGGKPLDRGHGIECRKCNIWLGDNCNDFTRKTKLTYRQIWNMRHEKKHLLEL